MTEAANFVAAMPRLAQSAASTARVLPCPPGRAAGRAPSPGPRDDT